MSSSEEGGVSQKGPKLEDLCAFIDDTDSWIDQTLSTLGWTRDHVVKVYS